MNTTLEEQLEYAKAMIEVLDPNLKLMKPEFRQAAARQLVYIAEQIAARYNAPESATEPEPESSEPAEPQVKMPEPPVGMKWEYRGMGWRSENPVFYAFATPYDIQDGDALTMSGYPNGQPDYYYWEAVPIAPKPAEPDRPVIDLAMKYRTRDGREVTDLEDEPESPQYPFRGIVDSSLQWGTNEGRYSYTSKTPHHLDLIPTGETV